MYSNVSETVILSVAKDITKTGYKQYMANIHSRLYFKQDFLYRQDYVRFVAVCGVPSRHALRELDSVVRLRLSV